MAARDGVDGGGDGEKDSTVHLSVAGPWSLQRSETAPDADFGVRREKSVDQHLPASRRVSKGRHKRRLSDPLVQEAADDSCLVTVLVQQRFRVPRTTPLEDLLPKLLTAMGLDSSEGDRLSIFMEGDGEEALNATRAAATAAGQKAHFKRLQLSKSLAEQCDDSKRSPRSGFTCLLSSKPHRAPISVAKSPRSHSIRRSPATLPRSPRDQGDSSTRLHKRMKSDFVTRPGASQRRSLHLDDARSLRSKEDLKRSAPKATKTKKTRAAGKGNGGDQLKEMRNFTFGHGLHPALSPSLSLPLTEKGGGEEANSDAVETTNPDPVFGTSLEAIMDRAAEPHEIPNVIVALRKHLLDHCLATEGIFRTSGSMERVAALTRLLDHSELPTNLDLSGFHPHVVAEVFKNFLRGMPRPVVPSIMFERALATTHLAEQEELRLMYSQALVAAIPEHRHRLLLALLRFLREVEQHQEENKMSRKNLCIVFGPLILRQLRNDDLSEMLSNLERVSEVVNHLIENVDNFTSADSPLVTGFVDTDQEGHTGHSTLKLEPGDVIHVYGRVKKKLAIEREGEFGMMSAKVHFTSVSLYTLTPPQRQCGHNPSRSVPSDLVKGLLSPRRISQEKLPIPEKTKGKKDKKKRRGTAEEAPAPVGAVEKGSETAAGRRVSLLL